MRWGAIFLIGCGSSAAPVDSGPIDAGIDDSAPVEDLSIWPNSESVAISDPWIAEHHDAIREMHPRVLALNFFNGKSNADMEKLFASIMSGLEEGSRWHGYADANAPPFLFYSIGKSVDLTDAMPPQGWPYQNSTKYPRKPMGWMGQWSFDYAALFGDTFTAHYGGTSLCEMLDKGVVHEIWIYGSGDVPDVSAAEVLENKQRYDVNRMPIAGKFDRCAGNGCFDMIDVPKCGRSVRIGWVNATRGPGCFLHSLGHGFEGTARGSIVTLQKEFAHFANLDLGTRLGLPFSSFYVLAPATQGDCAAYPSPNALAWTYASNMGTADPYDQGCGNVHFPPNARHDYDYDNTAAVLSMCEHYGEPNATPSVFSIARSQAYDKQWGDCGGGWQVYWRQSFVGRGHPAMKNWGPDLFY